MNKIITFGALNISSIIFIIAACAKSAQLLLQLGYLMQWKDLHLYHLITFCDNGNSWYIFNNRSSHIFSINTTLHL